MPQQAVPDSIELGEVCGRKPVGAFGGGALTSDAGAVLLSATDRATGLVDRLARCFTDGRDQRGAPMIFGAGRPEGVWPLSRL